MKAIVGINARTTPRIGSSGISSLGTMRTFLKVGTCSEALCNMLDRAYDHPLTPEEHAVMPLAGGIMQHGYQCGQIWGAALAAGAQAYQLLGPSPQAEVAALLAAQRLVDSFRARNKEINCLELTEIDWHNSKQALKFFLKGGTIRCLAMSARFSKAAFNEINTALYQTSLPTVDCPVSCAAQMARLAGASDLHVVMAAGLAGGIGLSGGACGALGAAVWMIGLNRARNGAGEAPVKVDGNGAGKDAKVGEKGSDWMSDFNDPRAVAAVDAFLKISGYEFECSTITGRQFANLDEHAAYLRAGGCSEIIACLAAQVR